MVNVLSCKDCKFFLDHITIIDEFGLETWGYGCSLGGGLLSPDCFFNGCDNFKLKVKEK